MYLTKTCENMNSPTFTSSCLLVIGEKTRRYVILKIYTGLNEKNKKI